MSKPFHTYSIIAAALCAAAVLASLVPMVWFAVGQGGSLILDSYIWSVLRFTVLQAGLSTILSIALALPAAWVLAGYKFAGRDFLLAIFAVPQMMPAIVVVLALTGVFGRSGWLPNLFNLYSLSGIVLAHAFFNAPLCIRLFVGALQSVKLENNRLATQLGLSGFRKWQHVDWPAIRTVLPHISLLVFLYCAASFVVVLTFGGPSATTLEVAIYQSLRLDFDVARAISLAILQIILCLVLVTLIGRFYGVEEAGVELRKNPHETLSSTFTLQQFSAIILPLVLVIAPLVHLLWVGLPSINIRPILLQAVLTSGGIALFSALVSLLIAWPLAAIVARRAPHSGVYSAIVMLGLIIPPAVLATGWFILLRGSGGSYLQSAGLICVLNSLMALPLVFSILRSAMVQNLVGHDQLCDQLRLRGWLRFSRIDYPIMRFAIFQSALIACVLSMGDLTAVMLLGAQGLITMPSLIASEMGNYRSTTAQGTALLLASICISLAYLAQKFAVAQDSDQ